MLKSRSLIKKSLGVWMCLAYLFVSCQRKTDIRKGVKRRKDVKESTETDDIINIFIYETGGVEISPFMSSPFVRSVFHQTLDSHWGQIRNILLVFLPQQVFVFLMVLKDFQVIYGSIYSRNKVVCESFVSCSQMEFY